jgi:tRNA(Ile)-lysidine synthase
MARSRKSVDEALGAALAAPDPADPSAAADSDRPWAVAWSGGLDSTVLLHAAVRLAGPSRVLALHVHHGLQPAADDWVGHCAARAARLGVAFRALRAEGAPRRGDSVERWAREARYRLLLDAAREARAAALLTAHHADDQIETLLLALARGSGLDGLTGIAPRDRRAGVALLRPLLGLERAALAADARARGLDWVEDPSNADTAFARSALRLRALPALREALPGLAGHVHDALDALRQARAAIDEIAMRDLEAARDAGGALERRGLAALSGPRRATALRAWIAGLGAAPPSRARLAQIEAQLLDGRGARGEVVHAGLRLARYRETLMAGPAHEPTVAARTLRWRGETRIALGRDGELCFEQIATGLAPDWLAAQSLRIGPAGSAERLRPRAGQPRRTLKNLRQEAGVPPWRREAYPAVWAGSRLLLAAPFGLDRSDDWPSASPGIEIAWAPPPVDASARGPEPVGPGSRPL